MRDVFILDATRTPWGKLGGGLKDHAASDLAAHLVRTLVTRNAIDPGLVDNVILGQVLQAGAGQLPARQALIGGGLPDTTPAVLVNKVCGSGMRAVSMASQFIRFGDNDLVLAGGMESMSNTPYYDTAARWGARMGDRTLIDGMVHDGLWCAFDDVHMANQGDTMATARGVTRQQMDEWSVMSQRRWGEAFARGYFEREVSPVPSKRDPNHVALAKDESPRPNSTAERLGRIATVYGTCAITAGNAPGVNDGAAVLVLGSERACSEIGGAPIARVVAHSEVAVAPGEFPIASAFAIEKVLAKTGHTLAEMKVIEINEAFAAVPLICGTHIELDPARVNRMGGSVAMGHPIGASGARLVLTAACQLQELGGGYGVAAICSGTGQGDAILLEAF